MSANSSALHIFFLFSYLPALLLIYTTRRYLLPVLPLLALLVFDGAGLTWRWLSDERARRGVKLALLALVCITPYWRDGYANARRLRAQLDLARGAAVTHQGHEALLDLVRKNRHQVSRGDVIATMHANVLRYFVPGDVAVKYLPLSADVDKAYRSIRDGGATYLYCDKIDASMWVHVDPVIKTYASSFELIAENPGAVIYRVVP